MRTFNALHITTDQIKSNCSYCRTDLFQNSNFCRKCLSNCFCRMVTVQFLNHFLSVQYYSISQPWITGLTSLILGHTWGVLLLMCIISKEASEKHFPVSLYLIWLMVKSHTSDIQMTNEYVEVTYEYIRVICRWNTDDIWVCTSMEL